MGTATNRSIRSRCAAQGWIALGLLFGDVAAAHAASVYKCLGADGSVAFQDRACAAQQRASRVELAPTPVAAADSLSAKAASSAHPTRDRAVPMRGTAVHTPAAMQRLSFECRTADGQVFYRHGACPRSIKAAGTERKHGRRGRAVAAQTVAVSARPLPRSEACRLMSGYSTRGGRELDERVSAYERNLGRDPCR